MNIDEIVGCRTISIICDELEKYIKLFTADGFYKGKLDYLLIYKMYVGYLRKEK